MSSKYPPGFCKGPSWEADSPVMDKHDFGMMSDAAVYILTPGREKSSGGRDLEVG